jgi:hypothetical protein
MSNDVWFLDVRLVRRRERMWWALAARFYMHDAPDVRLDRGVFELGDFVDANSGSHLWKMLMIGALLGIIC